ncbi:MAG TPA: hypothetical protein VEJ68_03500 [Candidatus Bathyarchaeia archaeon]|nr:hypothetical protein [Candidatus Bathyarchaeia archaeon]
MKESEYNSQIEQVALLIVRDKISLDENDPKKLQKYYEFARKNFHLENQSAEQLVNEAFLYLKLKTSDSLDPLQHGDEFGAGFS